MRSTGYIVWYWKNGLCEEKQIENHGHTFLAGRADFNRHTWKQGPKPLKKPKGAANLQSSQKISISGTHRNEIRINYLVPREGNNYLLLEKDLQVAKININMMQVVSKRPYHYWKV